MGNRETAIARFLSTWHEEYKNGKRERFLDAMSLCLTFDVPVPDWVSIHFQWGYLRYSKAESWTLDEAFDVRRPRNSQHAATKERINRTPFIYCKVARLVRSGVGTKSAIATIAEQENMSSSKVEKIYNDPELKARFGAPLKNSGESVSGF